MVASDVSNQPKAVQEIINLFHERGDEGYFGEDVTKTEHSIQCAMSAKHSSEPDHVVLACLLHDVGHLVAADDMGGLGCADHGSRGYEWLRKRGVEERVCHLVKQHVAAKRYLVSTDASYYDKLSDASKKTLEFQGGKMNEDELSVMKNDPELQNVLNVRKHDEIGKVFGKELPTIESFAPLMSQHLEAN